MLPATNAALTTLSADKDTARCEWPKRKGNAPAPNVFAVGDAQVDIVRLAAGLPPLADDQKKQATEQWRVDDALEGSIGCEVREVNGQMPASHYAFATDDVLDEVARCFHEPGRARKGEVVVWLSFDERGQPRRAHVGQANLEAPTVKCVEDIFSELPLTDGAPASAHAVVRLELDLPAVR